MKMITPEGNDLLDVESIDVEDGKIVIRGVIMGHMPMISLITAAEMRTGFKLLSLKKIFALISLLFRR